MYEFAERFVAKQLILSHSAEKFVKWITVLFQSVKILRIDFQFCLKCRNFCQLNYSFVWLCRKLCGSLLDFVSEYRILCEVNYSFVRLCKELCGEKLNCLSRRRNFRELKYFFLSQGQHFRESNYSFVRLCWKNCGNILTFLSQCRKNWELKTILFQSVGKTMKSKKLSNFTENFVAKVLILSHSAKNFWGELQFCLTVTRILTIEF